MKPFVLPVKTALGYYIYDTNKNEILVVSEDLFNYVSGLFAGEDDISASRQTLCDFSELQEYGYFLPSIVETISHPLTESAPIRLNRALGNLILQVTRNCNLRCKYCVYSEDKNKNQRSHSTEVMSFDTAKKALDFYWEHITDTDLAMIGFYGGEPLLEMNLIRKVVDYAESIFEGRKIMYSLTTNATLLSEETIEFLIDRNFSVIFSIDGPEAIQNKNRVFSNGNGSYQTVISNIKKFYHKDPSHLKNASINMVLDPEIKYQDILSLLGNDFFQEINVHTSSMEEDGKIIPLSVEYIEEYNYELFLSLAKHFRELEPQLSNAVMRRRVNDMDLENRRFLSSSLGKVSAPGGACIPGKPRLFVDVYGNLYPCEKVNESEAMQIGSIDTGIDFDKAVTLLNLGKLTAEKCKNCWAFSLCNICAKQVDSGTGISEEAKSQYCDESKGGAFYRILQKILSYENEIHLKKSKNWRV